MTVVQHMSKDVSQEEQIWRAGCYLVPYSVLTGEVLWTIWPWERIVREGHNYLLPWLKEHWLGIHTRTERRCVRTPDKFAASLLSYRDWAQHTLPQILDFEQQHQFISSRAAYDRLWESANTVYALGRYIIIRLLELFRRSGLTKANLYDIRSIGGWSPIRMLCLFYPEATDRLLKGDAVYADTIAQRLLKELQQTVPLLNSYQYAAILCEIRVALENGRQYAGWTIDQELSYFQRYGSYWSLNGLELEFLGTRKDLFPLEVLGEINGWKGLREGPMSALKNYGVVWTDLKYDYNATLATGDFSHPVERVA
jgi:hypothetical protein